MQPSLPSQTHPSAAGAGRWRRGLRCRAPPASRTAGCGAPAGTPPATTPHPRLRAGAQAGVLDQQGSRHVCRLAQSAADAGCHRPGAPVAGVPPAASSASSKMRSTVTLVLPPWPCCNTTWDSVGRDSEAEEVAVLCHARAQRQRCGAPHPPLPTPGVPSLPHLHQGVVDGGLGECPAALHLLAQRQRGLQALSAAHLGLRGDEVCGWAGTPPALCSKTNGRRRGSVCVPVPGPARTVCSWASGWHQTAPARGAPSRTLSHTQASPSSKARRFTSVSKPSRPVKSSPLPARLQRE